MTTFFALQLGEGEEDAAVLAAGEPVRCLQATSEAEVHMRPLARWQLAVYRSGQRRVLRSAVAEVEKFMGSLATIASLGM